MLLLDTNVILWYIAGDSRLGAETRKLVNATQTVHFSSVSMVEIEIKTMNGKLSDFSELVTDLKHVGVRELPLTSAHSAALKNFPQLVKHDPFDRMIVAQAKASNLSLLTSDRHLLALGEDWIIDARA